MDIDMYATQQVWYVCVLSSSAYHRPQLDIALSNFSPLGLILGFLNLDTVYAYMSTIGNVISMDPSQTYLAKGRLEKFPEAVSLPLYSCQQYGNK